MKTTQIKIDITLSGEGVFNSNGGTAPILNDRYKRPYANYKFAKFIETPDHRIRFLISPQCLKSCLFSRDNRLNNTLFKTVINSPNAAKILANINMSDDNLLRGWLFTVETANGYKRASPLTITPAITTESYEYAEQVGTQGPTQDENSLYYTQTTNAQKMEYQTTIILDLSELGFISLEDIVGRQAIEPSMVAAHIEALRSRFGVDGANCGVFAKDDLTKTMILERGITLNETAVKQITKDFLTRLTKLFSRRGQSYIEFKSFEAKLVGQDDSQTFGNVDDLISSLEVNSQYIQDKSVSHDQVMESFENGIHPAELMANLISNKETASKAKKEKKSKKVTNGGE